MKYLKINYKIEESIFINNKINYLKIYDKDKGKFTVNNKINPLKKYNKDMRILNKNDIKNIDQKKIPLEWYEALMETENRIKIKKILDIWEVNVSYELRNTISYLKDFLIDVDIMQLYDEYSLLYTIHDKNSNKGPFYYEGKNPMTSKKSLVLAKCWDKMPKTLKNFYENVHNGFFGTMGLVSLEQVTYFDDDEWGIIEVLKEPLQLNLKTTFGFFKNGGSGYVAVDIENCKNDNATLWWSNDQPEYNLNFWDVVDEWMVIGLQN